MDSSLKLVDHLKYGVIKSYGVSKFMKLKNNLAERQNAYNKMHKEELDAINAYYSSLPEGDSEQELTPEMKADAEKWMETIITYNLKLMEYIISPSIDELCELVEKIGQQVTVETIDIDELTMEEIVALGINIIKMDDARSKEEAEEKKKLA